MAEQEPTFSRSFAHPDRRKVVAAVGACLAVIVSAAVAMGASPGPSTTSGAGASAAPGASAKPHAEGSERPDRGVFKFKLKGGGFGPFAFGGPGIGIGLGRGGVEITAIDGSKVSLKTVDGWTRTIEVTSSTQITKGGATIALNDLAVGDTIRFRQKRNDDGTFTVTRIEVVLPSVAGIVTAKTSSTITLRQSDGSSVTVHVNGSTQFRVQGVTGAAKLSDVAVGMGLVANGEKNADGSLNASRVLAGDGRKLRAGGKPGNPHDDSQGAPDASPEGSSNPG
jgi:hypothetical protein